MLIDPHFSLLQDYLDFVVAERLKPVAVLDTQLHYSHPAASHALRRQFDIAPNSGRRLLLGEQSFEILPTPGVRKDALCIRGGGLVFTGETLWNGASSGFGMPGSDLGELWKTLQWLKTLLDPEEIVFSGYDVRDLVFSTWLRETERNPDLLARDPEEFARLKARFPFRLAEDFLSYARFNSDPVNEPSEFHKTESPFHLERLEREPPGYARLAPEKLANKLSSFEDPQKGFLIDVREPEEFASGHIPGARSIPLGELAFSLQDFRASPRVYVYCQLGRRSALAAGTLSYLGLPDMVILSGGLQSWLKAGLPLEKQVPNSLFMRS
jgi:rhodanese-related sulfurtransferase/glyoxylase-like metal-dependent hydrolase (beta-lactamase superfamily II)